MYKYQANLYFPLTVNSLEACVVWLLHRPSHSSRDLSAGTVSQGNVEAWQRPSCLPGKDRRRLLSSTHPLTGPRCPWGALLGQGEGWVVGWGAAGSRKPGMSQRRSVMMTETLELKVRVKLSGMDQKEDIFGIAPTRPGAPTHSQAKMPSQEKLAWVGFKYPKVRWTGQAENTQVNPGVTQGRSLPSSPAEAS